ncbi:sialidase family protein [Paraburkholderia sp. JHI2823]|uniref:sialidase family protein n=1 Tax=Paraburkholderia sp. JHI2823 TaxID=3112960 RepID=UPI0031720952
MSNIQVTHDSSVNNARSESNIVVNPNNPKQIVAGSKKFKDIHNYDFILATEYSTDGGLSWHDSAAFTLSGFTLLTDPALAWDDVGNVYLVGLSGNNPPTFDTAGIVIYGSTDGGQTWSAPKPIHNSAGDDKQWAAGDANPASPFHGRVYAVWDDGSDMRFARTTDHGATWVGTGVGATPAGTVLVNDSFSPEINVAANGDIYIVWIAGNEIKMIVSTDGGDSFSPATSPATGVTTLDAGLPAPHGWPVFPGGTFRVLTIPSASVFGSTIAVAWADFREGVSRIYCAVSTDGGASWPTGLSGKPLLAEPISTSLQHFHPQIVFDPGGVIGCAFYEFGPKPSTPLIDVIIAQSVDGGASFSRATVTDQPWDPAIDAPWSHGDSNVTFIGDYFGLDASTRGFYPLWTDTRTGIQELWTDIVQAHARVTIPPGLYGQVAQILDGIIQDGGGDQIVGGHIVHIPPWGPELDILLGVAIQRIATLVASPGGIAIQRAAMAMVAHVAQQEIKRLEGKE